MRWDAGRDVEPGDSHTGDHPDRHTDLAVRLGVVNTGAERGGYVAEHGDLRAADHSRDRRDTVPIGSGVGAHREASCSA